ncbi:MAG: hypothetical protein JW864_02705 [Spirochaetes bacterium]|nr:hypothetical protein [Spirochaetota bacterium]
MAKTKYGHWIKPIPPFKDYGQGNFRQGTEMGKDFFGYDFNVKIGTFYNSGILQPEQTQVCDYDQMMIWIGTDTDDIGLLGGQVEFCLGDEKERTRITTATAVSIPKGMPHFPVTVGPVDKRFILMTLSMTAEVKSKTVLEDKPVGPYSPWLFGTYSKYIKECAFKRNGPWHYGPENPDTNGGHITDIDGVGFDFNMSYESMKKAPYRFTPFPDKPHVHPYTEFLVFTGCDCDNLNEFPAEVEICMGEEMETHLVTQPTIAIQPKGFPHCPVRVLKQSKPWMFMVLRPWGQGGDVYSGGEETARDDLR